jgi:D-alanyl-D-alanine dipeptidase
MMLRLILILLLVGACRQKLRTPNSAQCTQHRATIKIIPPNFVSSQTRIAFNQQLSFATDATLDSLSHQHFDDSEANLSPLEKSMVEVGLVDVRKIIPTLKIDLRYATTNNFMNEVLYTNVHRCFLQKETIIKLLKAYQLLIQQDAHLTFIIFDGARPQSVQYKMYDFVKKLHKTNYVASPTHGSMHNFGTAIDISLFDLNTNQEVDMGTPFDFFGPEAQPRFQQQMLYERKLTATQIKNRNLLRQVMKQAGFIAIQTEWWHFESFNKYIVRSKYKIIP